MNKQFLIRFHGPRNSIAVPYIEQFGRMELFDTNESHENFQTLIVECGYRPETVDSRLCKTLFEAGKTIGFLGITQRELTILTECTGRRHKMEGKNIFVRPLNNLNSDKKFDYTVFSGFPHAEIVDELLHNKTRIYNKLRSKFRAETAAPVYHDPIDSVITLYPIGDYQMIYGSRSTPLSTPVTINFSSMQDGYSGPSAATFNLQVDAYVYFTNGKGGKKDYRVIIHTSLFNLTPVSFFAEKTFMIALDNFPSEYTYFTYAYAMGITPVLPQGRNLNIQATVPDAGSTSSSGTYGYNITTGFGSKYGKYPILIPIQGQNTDGSDADIQFQPDFLRMINQKIFPDLVNYTINQVDSPMESKVQFLMPEPNSSLGSSGQFEMVSYFIIPAVPGEKSYPVTFNVELQASETWGDANGGNGGFGSGDPIQTLQKSFVLDLAELTDAPPYDPPKL